MLTVAYARQECIHWSVDRSFPGDTINELNGKWETEWKRHVPLVFSNRLRSLCSYRKGCVGWCARMCCPSMTCAWSWRFSTCGASFRLRTSVKYTRTRMRYNTTGPAWLSHVCDSSAAVCVFIPLSRRRKNYTHARTHTRTHTHAHTHTHTHIHTHILARVRTSYLCLFPVFRPFS